MPSGQQKKRGKCHDFYGQDDAIFELEAAELGYSLLTGNSPAEASTRGLG